MSSLNLLRAYIRNNNIDGYLIPKNDEFFSENSNTNYLYKITGFTGSAGLALVTLKRNILFVDGRYTLQAHKEAGKKFKIIDISKYSIKKITSNFGNIKIGFNPKLFTSLFLRTNFKNSNLIPDKSYIFKHSPKINQNNLFYNINTKISGETEIKKIKKLISYLKKNRIDNIFISAPENVAWLLNIRGRDSEFSPIPNCQIILTKNNKIYFFSNKKKIKNLKKIKLFKKFFYFDTIDFINIIYNLEGKSFIIDKMTCSNFYENLIKSKFKILDYNDPCYNFKSIKNSTEIKNTIKAHEKDGVALTKFLYWMKNSKERKSEISAQNILEKYRKKNKNYLYPSFNTISGSGPNGAIIHYRASKKTNRIIRNKDIYLCDSGGQYKYGTTDVTRTICFDDPGIKIKNIFTRVLKGHIAVVCAKLNNYTTGSILDKKARYWLNKINLDYPHGTGHGVGYFLNVHEGPQSISKHNRIKLKQGMILSNEPGFYKKNEYGIRIENLIYLKKNKGNLTFENLTLAPIDIDLINFKILTSLEKKYLSDYHYNIYKKIRQFLNENEKKWLKNLI